MSGPNGMIANFKIEGGTFEREGDGGCMDMIRSTGTGATFVSTAFDEDSNYLAAVTDFGQLLVQKMGPIQLVFDTMAKDKIFVKVDLLAGGNQLVASDSEGTLYFFERLNGEIGYTLIRNWTYDDPYAKKDIEESSDPYLDVIQGFQIM
jgi:hypothetical protein